MRLDMGISWAALGRVAAIVATIIRVLFQIFFWTLIILTPPLNFLVMAMTSMHQQGADVPLKAAGMATFRMSLISAILSVVLFYICINLLRKGRKPVYYRGWLLGWACFLILDLIYGHYLHREFIRVMLECAAQAESGLGWLKG
jgi:hypothetical protein